MKRLSVLISFLFCAVVSFAQIPNRVRVSNALTIYEIPNPKAVLSFMLPVADTLNNPATPYLGSTTILPSDSAAGNPIVYITNGEFWERWSGGGTGGEGGDTLVIADGLYVTISGGQRILHGSRITTVAGLRSATSPQSDVIYMTSDYGGGIWAWNDTTTAADNLGTIVKITGVATGAFERQYDGAINCLWFGISRDTTVDNSTPFINMFASMGGNSYYLPEGLFKISNEVMGDIIVPSNTHFFGAGMGLTIIKLFDSVSAGATATVNMMLTAEAGTNITIEGITLDGNRQKQSWTPVGSANYGLAVRSSNTTIVNVEIKNVTANGCGMATDNESENVIFDKIYSHANGKKGFHSGEVHNIKIINGFYYNNEEDAGIGIHAGMKDFLVDNNHCYNNRTGIQVGRTVNRPFTGNAIVSNNFIDSNEVNGISIGQSYFLHEVDSFDRNVQVIGNFIKDDLIQLTNASNVSLSGNFLINSYFEVNTSFNISIKNNTVVLDSNYNVAAIYIVGGNFGDDSLVIGNNIAVENNTITVGDSVDYGISAALTTNLTIKDNIIYGTPAIYPVRVWSKIKTLKIRQRGYGIVRIGSESYTNGYDNSTLTTSFTVPEHGEIGQQYWQQPAHILKVCSVAAIYDTDETTVTTPAVWVNSAPEATETLSGTSEFATQAETDAGVVQDKMISPFRLENYNDGITGTKYITGSEDAAGLLRLQSTKDVTKGHIEFGLTGNSWYSDADFNWGFGVGSTGTPVTTERVTIANSATGVLKTPLRLENRFSAVNTGVRLAFGAASSQTVTGAIDNVVDAVTDRRHLNFYTWSGSSLVQNMTIRGRGNVGIGIVDPDSSAKLHISSTTGGLLIPRLTTAQRDAVVTPATGLLIYNTTTSAFNFHNGTAWGAIGGGGGGDALTTNPLSQFAATTSAQLAGVISDEVGTDKLVFNTNPTLVGATLSGNLLANADNTLDIGESATRFRTAYLGTSLVAPLVSGGVNANEDITIQGTSHATKATSSVILQPTGGNVGVGTSDAGILDDVPFSVFGANNTNYAGGYPFNLAILDNAAHAIDVGGGIVFGGNDGAGTTNRWFSGFHGGKENATLGNYSGYLSFHTRVNGGAVTEKLRINSAGNVGIGVTAPTALLNIKAGTATANTAPIKLTAGTRLTTPEAGTIEYETGLFVLQSDALQIFKTTEQLRLGYDASNYITVSVASNGQTTINGIGSAPSFIFSDLTYHTAGISTSSASSTGSNLYIPSGTNSANTTNAEHLFGGASGIGFRAGIRGSTSTVQTANNSYGSFVIGSNPVTEGTSGTHTLFANAVIKPLIITAGAGATTNSATLYLEDAATGATNNYALWSDAGINRFDGQVLANDNLVVGTAGKGLQLQSGTDQRAGNATLVAGSVTVSNTTVTSNTLIFLTRKTSGGTIGTSITYTLSAGTSFTINSDNPLDTSTFTYLLMELN